MAWTWRHLNHKYSNSKPLIFFLAAMQNQPLPPCQSTRPMANGPVATLDRKIKIEFSHQRKSPFLFIFFLNKINDTTPQNEELKTSQLNQEICQNLPTWRNPTFRKSTIFKRLKRMNCQICSNESERNWIYHKCWQTVAKIRKWRL